MTRKPNRHPGRGHRFEPKCAVKPKPGETYEPPPIRTVDNDAIYDDWDAMNRQLWERKKNPLYAWESFVDAVKGGQQPPQWSAAIVLGGIDRMLALRKAKDGDIVIALGLKSAGRSYFTRRREDSEALAASVESADERRARLAGHGHADSESRKSRNRAKRGNWLLSS
jgi:hypothetical protein